MQPQLAVGQCQAQTQVPDPSAMLKQDVKMRPLRRDFWKSTHEAAKNRTPENWCDNDDDNDVDDDHDDEKDDDDNEL